MVARDDAREIQVARARQRELPAVGVPREHEREAQALRLREGLGSMDQQNDRAVLGQRAAVPVLATYEKFPDSFARRMEDVEYKPAFDVEAAIQRSIEIVREEETAR